MIDELVSPGWLPGPQNRPYWMPNTLLGRLPPLGLPIEGAVGFSARNGQQLFGPNAAAANLLSARAGKPAWLELAALPPASAGILGSLPRSLPGDSAPPFSGSAGILAPLWRANGVRQESAPAWLQSVSPWSAQSESPIWDRPFTEPVRASSLTAPEARSDHGGWTNQVGDGEGTSQILSDVTPDNYWVPGADYAGQGHHEFPLALYKRMPLETQKVFDRATSGQLYLGVDGRRHGYDSFHREYNLATEELLKRFMREQNITEPEQITPDHARAVLKAIAESEDPRIRLYREFIRRLRLFYRLRAGGRGSE